MTTPNDQSIATTPPANQSLATQPKPPKPAEVLRAQLQARQDAFALPKHITPEKFISVVTTAVSMDPKLLKADRASLLQSCLLAAQDGLLLDKRQAALVVFAVKDQDTQQWVDKVQYMPMIKGVLKKLRNSGEISTITAECVYQNDFFDFELGLEQRLVHKPNLDGDRGKPRCFYAVAKLKDGTHAFRVMTLEQINKRRSISKTYNGKRGPSGPWLDWYEEMGCKTVLRALCNVLPSSTDIDTMISRMDHDADVTRSPRRELPSLTEPDDMPPDGESVSVDGEVMD